MSRARTLLNRICEGSNRVVEVGKPYNKSVDRGRTKEVEIEVGYFLGDKVMVTARGEFDPDKRPKIPKAKEKVWSIWGPKKAGMVATLSFGRYPVLVAKGLTKKEAIEVAKRWIEANGEVYD